MNTNYRRITYAARSSRFGSEPPSVEDDVDTGHYAILEYHARNDNSDSRRLTGFVTAVVEK